MMCVVWLIWKRGVDGELEGEEPREQVVDEHECLHHVPLRLFGGLGFID
jgi:hypothetical protein